MPPRLTEVGDLERPDHTFLPERARCYFWGEYTPFKHTDGLNWDYSPTNKLMSNFKKKIERKGRSDWHYKGQAIDQVANFFAQAWKWQALHEQHRVAVIPIPPSKARTDPAYDPRMLEVLNAISTKTRIQLDIRDCLSFSGRYAASHESDDRPTPDDLYAELHFDAASGQPNKQPGAIFLFDDMLTTGAHYVAVTRKLVEVFPGIQVVGNFVARRITPNPFADIVDDFDVL